MYNESTSCFKDLVVKDHNTLMLGEPPRLQQLAAPRTRDRSSDAFLTHPPVTHTSSNNNLALKA